MHNRLGTFCICVLRTHSLRNNFYLSDWRHVRPIVIAAITVSLPS